MSILIGVQMAIALQAAAIIAIIDQDLQYIC